MQKKKKSSEKNKKIIFRSYENNLDAYVFNKETRFAFYILQINLIYHIGRKVKEEKKMKQDEN